MAILDKILTLFSLLWYTAKITEISECDEQKVCSQCFYGQVRYLFFLLLTYSITVGVGGMIGDSGWHSIEGD